MNTTTDYASFPLPAGVEFYHEDWRQSAAGETHYRRFATKKFSVFDGLTVWTGGAPATAGTWRGDAIAAPWVYAPQPGPHCRIRDRGPAAMWEDEQPG